MSYRKFQVYYNHFARDAAGLAGLSINASYAVESEFPLDHLIDDRQTTKTKFSTPETDHYIDIDMGVGFTGRIDTIIIPAGHSLDSVAIDLLGDTTFAPTTSRATFTPSGTGIIKEDVNDGGATRRYWRLEFNTNGQHEIHGLILTLVKTFTVGFVLKGSEDFPQHNFLRLNQSSGISPTIQKGLPQRVMALPFENALRTTDLATMEDWIATAGMHRPFYIDPPSFSATPDTDDPAILFKFDGGDPLSAWGTTVPNREVEKKTFQLRLIESVG